MLRVWRARDYSYSYLNFCREDTGGSGGSDADDEDLDEPGPSEAKKSKLKYSGAYKYKTRFSKDWTKTWSFITAVPGDQQSFLCTLCSKTLSCGHQGISDVKTHIAGKNHQRIGSQMSNQSQLSFASRMDPLSDKVFLFPPSISINPKIINGAFLLHR